MSGNDGSARAPTSPARQRVSASMTRSSAGSTTTRAGRHRADRLALLPGQRESWEAMTAAQQRAHALLGLQANHDSFGSGPKWTFAVDAAGASTSHTSIATLPTTTFRPVRPTSPARRTPAIAGGATSVGRCDWSCGSSATIRAPGEAHLIVDAESVTSRRVARAVGAAPIEQWASEQGRTIIRHVAPLDSIP